MYLELFRMPTAVKITGRTSTITNSFVNSIIPVVHPTQEEVRHALELLGMRDGNIECAYCGDACTEWDHLRPLVKNKKPTGFISEINNLVPACGKCNQSKGNKPWKDWMLSDAPRSPKTRRVVDIDERIGRLEGYEKQAQAHCVDFQSVLGEEVWTKHWENLARVENLLREAQNHSDVIKSEISKKF